MLLLASSVCGLFKWRQFEPEVILMAVGWYLRFSLSYRDVEELLADGKVRNIADQATDAPYKDEYCCAVIVNGKFLANNPKAAAAATRAP